VAELIRACRNLDSRKMEEALDYLTFMDIPYDDGWTAEEKVAFKTAYAAHGKAFGQMHREVLQGKTVNELVKYYYGWKRTREATDVLEERAAKRRRFI
jgi:hypothetical protein